jgi:hypothetical protein
MLDNLKMMLGITDTALDVKLNLIISLTTSRLKSLLGGIDPPAELDYIVLEVAIIRFNRIGSEGLTSHSVEGESLSFKDSDFDGYANDIQAFLDRQKDSTRGKVRFI